MRCVLQSDRTSGTESIPQSHNVISNPNWQVKTSLMGQLVTKVTAAAGKVAALIQKQNTPPSSGTGGTPAAPTTGHSGQKK